MCACVSPAISLLPFCVSFFCPILFCLLFDWLLVFFFSFACLFSNECKKFMDLVGSKEVRIWEELRERKWGEKKKVDIIRVPLIFS